MAKTSLGKPNLKAEVGRLAGFSQCSTSTSTSTFPCLLHTFPTSLPVLSILRELKLLIQANQAHKKLAWLRKAPTEIMSLIRGETGWRSGTCRSSRINDDRTPTM